MAIRSWQYSLPPLTTNAQGIADGRTVLPAPPDWIPRPIEIMGALIMNQGFPLPSGAMGGLWFVLADPGGYFTKTSRWPTTEAGPQGFFVNLAVMDFKPQLPMMVRHFLPEPYIFNDGDRLMADCSFVVPSTQGIGAQMIIQVFYKLSGSGPDFSLDAVADQYTKIILNMEGQTNTAAFRDTSNDVRTTTAYGNAKIIPSDMSGETAGVFDGVAVSGNKSCITVAASSDFNVGSGDFTVEAMVKPASTGGGYGVIACMGPGNVAFNFGQSGTKYKFYSSSNGTSWNVANGVDFGDAVAGVTASLAVVRDGNSIKLFCDGVLGATVSVSGALYDVSNPFTVGNQSATLSVPFIGEIDRVHYSVGIARYTAAYTPSTRPIVYP